MLYIYECANGLRHVAPRGCVISTCCEHAGVFDFGKHVQDFESFKRCDPKDALITCLVCLGLGRFYAKR